MARSIWPIGCLAGAAVVLAGAFMLWIPGRPGATTANTPTLAVTARRTWVTHLDDAERALAQQDLMAARQAWHRAYGAALASRRWEGLLDVGSASLRMTDVTGGPEASLATARRLYLDAFFRARAERSLEGVLRAAEGFAALGDGEVVAQCLRVAERMAGGVRDPDIARRLLALQDRQTAEPPDAKRLSRGVP